MLPICDSSSVYSYNFFVDFQSDNDGAADFIVQILQIRPIIRCRDVYFDYNSETFIQLPVEVIANWLNRNSDEIGFTRTGQSKKERYLAMNNQIKIQNAAEICDRLKMAFSDADSSVHPFIFRFSGGPVQRELIENEKTNEELYINCVESGEHEMSVRIERNAMEKKNSPETE